MNKRKVIIAVLCIIILIFSTSCALFSGRNSDIQLQTSKMQAICELAVMDCYFHNVAKFFQEDATGALFWTKDKHFWIEYSGIVSIGLDASLIELSVDEDVVTITLPKAKVLSSRVDEATLSEDSFIIAGDSADISAEDQTAAFADAQEKMVDTATTDTTLLAEAERRAQVLLSDYVDNIGEITEIQYTINWVYLDESGPEESDDANSENIEEAE